MEVQKHSLSLLPKRNKGSFNSSFKSLSITTNFHKAQFKNINQIFAFKIAFTPKIMYDNAKLRNDLLNKALPQISKFITTPVISGFTIYTSSPPTKSEESIQVNHQEIQYSILIKQVKNIQLTDSLKIKFIQSFFNNFLRGMMRSKNYVEIGKSGKFFNSKNKKQIDNLVMYSGYKANFQFLQSGLYLRVDTAKKFVRKDTVLDKINQIYRIHKDKSREEKREIVKSNLVGQTVMTNYGKTAYYRIVDISYAPMEEITFQCQGQTINIRNYFRKKYNIDFSQKQPLIEVETKKQSDKQTFLIPQLCQMTGIPEDFDEQRRKKISQATIRQSDQRKRDIQGLMSEIRNTEGFSTLQSLGVKINQKLYTTQARIISNPKLELGKGNIVDEGKESFFNLFSKPIYYSKHSVKLGIIFFQSTDLYQITKTINDTSRNLNVNVEISKVSAGDFDSRRAIQIIESLIQKCTSKDCNIVLVICPNMMRKDYGKIKQICLKKVKILCQFALQNTFKRKGAQSIITKILLQLIAKRGNTLWVPQTKYKHDACMLMSFDHSKMKNGKSVMAVIATVSSTFTSLYSKCQQFNNQEDKYHAMFKLYLKALQYYQERKKTLPKDIILLQNTVPRDQVELIKDLFIQKSISEVYKIKDTLHDKPNLMFVMVNTKNDQRFFDGPQSRNPRAGTIVSEEIVGNNFDFYMVSQYTTKGSSVPNHYDVIYNDSKMQEGVLHELLFAQCFNYVNWTGSIKVPGVLQYAKKCAKFHAEVLDGAYISSDMEGKLYYA